LSGSRPSVRVGFRTPKVGPIWGQLITDANLSRFGRTVNEIHSITYSEHYPGGKPYTELGLAGAAHPIVGSGSVWVKFNDGSRATISEIFYQDYNPNADHCNGKPHWNREQRFMYDTRPTPQFNKHPPNHCIPKSAWIEILSERRSGSIQRKRLVWR
jgi:hypothetical protein